MADRIMSDAQLNRLVANQPEVQGKLDEVARGIEGRAKANLAAHRKTGSHSIDVVRGKVDRHVQMHGPGAVALERGHYAKNGEFVEGTHILGRAASDA